MSDCDFLRAAFEEARKEYEKSGIPSAAKFEIVNGKLIEKFIEIKPNLRNGVVGE